MQTVWTYSQQTTGVAQHIFGLLVFSQSVTEKEYREKLIVIELEKNTIQEVEKESKEWLKEAGDNSNAFKSIINGTLFFQKI